ncbi:hypothetical protein [Bacteroides heparinolyticus]|uniref:hypothetical protein n=1 Tax=Prevotella heparinolytica TaxID=28113 RepID=UPI0035A175D9
MAYINTGYARNKILTVTKGGYSQDYNLCAGFVWDGATYLSLSDDGFARLSDSDYERRREAFISYVYSLEADLQANCPDMTIGSVEYNTTLCPLPGQVPNLQE